MSRREDRESRILPGEAQEYTYTTAKIVHDGVLRMEEQTPYPEDHAWVREVGGVEFVWTRRWGTVTERRFALPSGLEVELRVAPPSRAVTDPVDEGMRRIGADGVSVLYAPKRILAGLLEACGRSQATENSVGSGVGHA